MHAFASLEKFSELFYCFNKFVTVFCFNVVVFLKKEAVKSFNNAVIALRGIIKSKINSHEMF